MSTYKDIQKKKDDEIVSHVEAKREEIRKFRFGTAGAGTRDVRAIRAMKKEVARSLTELTARARAESNQKAK